MATNRKHFKMHSYVKHQEPKRVIEDIFPSTAQLSDSLD